MKLYYTKLSGETITEDTTLFYFLSDALAAIEDAILNWDTKLYLITLDVSNPIYLGCKPNAGDIYAIRKEDLHKYANV